MNIVIAQAASTIEVPDVIGNLASDATFKLKNAGFQVVSDTAESDQPVGTVIDQNPSAGTQVAREHHDHDHRQQRPGGGHGRRRRARPAAVRRRGRPGRPGMTRRVAVLMGGRSSEHEVSLASAEAVIAALDPARDEVIPVLISPDGVLERRG